MPIGAQTAETLQKSGSVCCCSSSGRGRLGAAVSCVHTPRAALSYLQTVQLLSDTKSSVLLLLLGEDGNVRRDFDTVLMRNC